MDKHTKIREILKRLKKAYGSPRPYKATDPVDELIRTVLSQNTNDKNSLGAFAELKKRFGFWEELVSSDTRHIATIIKHAGLANIKAKRIKEILLEIKHREGTIAECKHLRHPEAKPKDLRKGDSSAHFGPQNDKVLHRGKIDLSFLKDIDVSSGLDYLMSLKGVGPKTAACVMLFSFNKPVMPVDTHIYRIAKRLGLIGSDIGIEEAHKILTAISIPNRPSKPLIYELHLCIIEHGRRTCKAQNPRCGFCVLYDMCNFKDKRLYKHKERVN